MATPTFDIDVIDQQIKKELQSLQVVFEKFITNPEPPIWVSPDYATPINREVPPDCHGKPSHDLHAHNVGEVKKYFGSIDHLFVVYYACVEPFS